MIKPSEVSASLRCIAAIIENSKNPRKELVAQDLKEILAAVTNRFDDKAIGEVQSGIDALKKEQSSFMRKSEDSSYNFSDYDRELYIWKVKEIVTDLSNKLKDYNEPSPPFGTTPKKMRPYVPS